MKIVKYILILAVVALIIFFAYNKLADKTESAPELTPDTSIESNVETYIRETISTLSPVEATMGGTWYVVSVEVDEDNNKGSVVYEDGHNQEERNFTFTTDEEGGILTLTIE